MNAYGAVLFTHSWLRWAILVACLVLLVRTLGGWLRSRSWTRTDDVLQIALTAMVDLQLLLGFWLYTILSPVTRAFLADPATGMKDASLRFFGMEHLIVALLAVATVHVGRMGSRQAATPRSRQARASVFGFILLLLILAAIPWPAFRYGRPLLRVDNERDVSRTVRCVPSAPGSSVLV